MAVTKVAGSFVCCGSHPHLELSSRTLGENFIQISTDIVTKVDHCWEAAAGDMPVRTEGSGTRYDGRVWTLVH